MAQNQQITRINKFFSDNDMDFHLNIGTEYLHGDLDQKIVLYRVDRSKTDKDNVYAEVGKNAINFFTPVEFNALVRIESSKNETYKDGILRYNEPGNMTISVYLRHLEELGIDINYGDYIGWQETTDKMRFYNVVNDGKITTDNKHNLFGYMPYYRTILCAYVQDSEFNGL